MVKKNDLYIGLLIDYKYGRRFSVFFVGWDMKTHPEVITRGQSFS